MDKGGTRSNTNNRRERQPNEANRLTRSMVMSIRLHALRSPIKRMDLDLIDACDSYLIGGDLDPILLHKAETLALIRNRIAAESPTRRNAQGEARRETRRIKPAMAILLALLAILLLLCTALAAGWLPWELSISWESGSMNISIVAHEEVKPVESLDANPAVLGEDVVEALKTLDVDVKLPSWLPEGYALTYLYIRNQEHQAWRYITAQYENSNGNLILTVRKASTVERFNNGKTELSDGSKEILEINGVSYYLFDNLERQGVVWFEEPCIITIFGMINRDEIIRILDSINIGG